MTARRRRVVATLGAVLLPACLAAHAAQIVEVRDGSAVEAPISRHGPTRVRIEGAPIRNVVGNLQANHCGSGAGLPAANAAPAAAGAELLVECDRDKGEIYLRPLGTGDAPITLFVSSPHATYTLRLQPTDAPADTIVLRDRTVPATAAHTPTVLGPSANPIRRLKALLVAMAAGPLPADLHETPAQREVPLWRDVRFTLQRRVEGRGLIGEHYALHNLGNTPIVLAEQEFDRGHGRVLGVAIEHHHLRPGQTTQVYVLRLGEAP